MRSTDSQESVVILRLCWVLATLLVLAFFLPGLILQAGKAGQGALGIWMSSTVKGSMIVAVAPGLSADRAGLKPGDLIVTRSEKWDPKTGKWINDIAYQDQSGGKHHIVIESTPPDNLPFNLSTTFFGWLSAAFDLLFFLAYLLVGTLIVWRAGAENEPSARRFALIAAFSLLITAVRIPPEIYVVLDLLPHGNLLDAMIRMLGYVIFPLFLSLFPNGRWTPRKIWIYPLVSTIVGIIVMLTGWRIFPSLLLNNLFDVLVTGIGVSAQVYRYRQASTAQERQQTKWAIFGIGSAFIVYYIFQFTDSFNWTFKLFPWLQGSGASGYLYIVFWKQLTNAALLLVPVTLAVSILRYRLWDIDLIIRRTLAYTVITSLLAATYFIMIVALQHIFRLLTGQSSTLAIILSTLAISLLFAPVRQWVQGAVDRRFYRGQYNAAQTLERFSSAMRSEVELDRLSGELVDVVEDSLHPDAVSLWIIPALKE